YVLEAAGARLLLTVIGFLGTDYPALLAAAGTPAGLEVVELGALGQGVAAASSRLVARRAGAVTRGDPPAVMFTSGTTGRPKGAMLTHGATMRVFTAWVDCVGLRTDDRYLIVNPFFHTFGLKAGILACVMTGATMVPMATLDLPVALATIERERITTL